MSDDQEQSPIVPTPDVPSPSDVEQGADFTLVRPYIASLGEAADGPKRTGRRRAVGTDSKTVLLDIVTPSVPDDADIVPGLATPGRHRRPSRTGLVVATGVALVLLFTGGYLLWTPRASPAELLVVPSPAPLPDFSATVASPAPSVSATPPSSAQSSKSRSASPSGSSSPSLSPPPSPTVTASPDTPAASPSSTPPSTPPPTTPGPTTGAVVGPGGMCLDDNEGSTRNGSHIQLWSCNGSAAQVWTWESDGTMRVVGDCMLASTSGFFHGRIVVWDCFGSDSEVWRAGHNNSLVNAATGMCLDAPGGSTGSGTWLDFATCNDSASQSWTFH